MIHADDAYKRSSKSKIIKIDREMDNIEKLINESIEKALFEIVIPKRIEDENVENLKKQGYRVSFQNNSDWPSTTINWNKIQQESSK